MRLDPVFITLLVVPLALAALAVAPVSWPTGRAQPEVIAAPEAALSPGTDWIAPFAQRLTPRIEAAVTPDARAPLEDWRLVGLVEGDQGFWITVAGRGEVRTLTIGDELSGFELIQVVENTALFRRGDEEQTLQIAR